MMKSIALRMAVAFGLVAAIVFSISGVALYQALAKNLNRQLDDDLRGKVEVAAGMVNKVRSITSWEQLRSALTTITTTDGNTRFWITCEDEALNFGAPFPNISYRNLTRSINLLAVDNEKYPMKTLGVTLRPLREVPEILLVVGVGTASMHQTLQAFAVALVLINCGGIALVAALGYWIARTGLQPVVYLSDAARNITAKNMAHRLSLAPSVPELSPLVNSFNGALERVEVAYTQLAGFSADVAHELRTPIGNMIGMTQVMLTRERGAGELREALTSNLEELHRLVAIVNDMLFLARADRGERVQCQVPARMSEEVQKTIDFVEPLFEDKQLSVEIVGDFEIAVDTAMFRRAISNLLQNAIQHSEPCSKITVDISSGEEISGMTLAVSNIGRPIRDDQIVRLFDRFYRGDPSRASSSDNHGLGLAIVKAIATMHGGSTFARSVAGVNTFGLSVPT